MKEVMVKIIEQNYLDCNAVSSFLSNSDYSHFNNEIFTIFPGFCDVHVHFREPGFVYKEDILSGTQSAARGGYTAVCTMPNLNPVPDSEENINIQLAAIKKKAIIPVFPYASITEGQKGETISNLLQTGANVIAFSDDGKGVQSEDLMLEAMLLAKKHNAIIVAHCEDNKLLFGGYIHDGEYAKKHNHKGISSASEYMQIARDIELAKKTSVKYHVCHISTKESVEIIRKAKSDGVDITCETAPHYLILDESNLQECGDFKMNPPIRAKEDRLALIEGIKDGTIDMIATDHAPHSAEEKSRGLEKSLFGVVGLETAFPALYTHLVLKNIITLEKLVQLMCINPRKRFNINTDIGFSIWNLNKQVRVDTAQFLSKGKSTPFKNMTFYAENQLTAFNNEVVYQKKTEK